MSAFGHIGATAHRRPSSSAVLAGVSLLAAALGAILALAFGDDGDRSPRRATPSPVGRTIAAGDLRLTLPEGWAPLRTRPDIPGFEGARAAFARSGDADVAIALLPAARPSLLPRRLDAARSPGSSRPRVIRAGEIRAYHYVLAPADQRVLEVLAAPTTQGIATIACSSTVVAPGECELALRGLRLARGSFLPLTGDAGFLARLPAVAVALDARRVRLRTRLTRASLSEGAARTAARLAGAYAAAGRALRPLVAARSEAATVLLLDRLHVRYGRLAGALRARDRAAFARSARAIGRAESALAAGLVEWQGVQAFAG